MCCLIASEELVYKRLFAMATSLTIYSINYNSTNHIIILYYVCSQIRLEIQGLRVCCLCLALIVMQRG